MRSGSDLRNGRRKLCSERILCVLPSGLSLRVEDCALGGEESGLIRPAGNFFAHFLTELAPNFTVFDRFHTVFRRDFGEKPCYWAKKRAFEVSGGLRNRRAIPRRLCRRSLCVDADAKAGAHGLHI